MVRLGIMGNDNRAISFLKEAAGSVSPVFLSPGQWRKEDVDALYITGEYDISFREAMDLLAGAKHILMDGISRFSLRQLTALLEAAGQRRVTFMENFYFTANPWLTVLNREMYRLGRIYRATFLSCGCCLGYGCGEADRAVLADVDFSCGALMEKGVCCIYPVIKCFGLPEHMESEPVFCENGMDIAGSIRGQCGGVSAEILYSSVSGSHMPSQIRGEKGRFVIKGIGAAPKVVFYDSRGESEVLLTGDCKKVTEYDQWRGCLEDCGRYAAYREDMLMLHEMVDRIVS